MRTVLIVYLGLLKYIRTVLILYSDGIEIYFDRLDPIYLYYPYIWTELTQSIQTVHTICSDRIDFNSLP